MADLQEKKDAGKSAPQDSAREVPLDTRLLSDAIIELNISRKNVGIYPPGHIQIVRSIERTYDILQKVFEIRREMTLGVAKDTLLVGSDYLDRKNPVYRDFALSMNQQGIASVTFIRGLDKDELIRFHRVLTTKPEAIVAGGGILQVMADAGISRITVKAIDYSALHLTEEREIVHGSGMAADAKGAGLWQDFVSHLSAGTVAKPGQDRGVSLREAEQIDPRELARLLNERRLDPAAAIQSYDAIISHHIRDVAEKRELTREQTETLRNMNNLMKDLNPELRKQFLSTAFSRTADASPAATEEVLGGLTDGMVIEMLQQANVEGREISPTLTGLLNKLTSVSAKVPEAPEQSPPVVSADQMQKLFEREQYETYVSPEYDATLKRLSEGGPAPGTAAIEGFPIEEYAASMTDENLDMQIGRVTLAFIDEDLDDEDYGEFLKKILAITHDLLVTENFSLLHDILLTLRMHSRSKRSMVVRSMVDMALRTFDDPEFQKKAVASFGTCSKARIRSASGFLLALGPNVLPLLFDLYLEDPAPGGRREVFDLLCRFGNAAVKEAVFRLDDSPAPAVRNLIMLIRWGWDASPASRLRPLLKHKDQKVRHEALIALLRFRDATSVPELEKAIGSSDPDEASFAIKLAGQFRVAEVIDALLKRLRKRMLFETDFMIAEEVIVALGEIGQRRVMPELEKLAKTAFRVHRSRAEQMKAELFESLDRYPPEAAVRMIAIGEQSDNERIQRACKRLAERKR